MLNGISLLLFVCLSLSLNHLYSAPIELTSKLSDVAVHTQLAIKEQFYHVSVELLISLDSLLGMLVERDVS